MCFGNHGIKYISKKQKVKRESPVSMLRKRGNVDVSKAIEYTSAQAMHYPGQEKQKGKKKGWKNKPEYPLGGDRGSTKVGHIIPGRNPTCKRCDPSRGNPHEKKKAFAAGKGMGMQLIKSYNKKKRPERRPVLAGRTPWGDPWLHLLLDRPGKGTRDRKRIIRTSGS